MSSPNEKKPDEDVIATYKCQRRTGKMRLIGTRRATYLDIRRMYGVGAKLAPYDSDEEGEGSKVVDLGNKGEGSKKKGLVVDVVKSEVAEPPSVAPTPEKTVEEAVDLGRSRATGVVTSKKRVDLGPLLTRMSIVDRWRGDSHVDKRYVSDLAIDWNHISEVMETLIDKNDYKAIGLLNFKENEVDSWQEMLPSPEHMILHLDHVPKSLTWETLYPEWIDEEEDFEIPSCPSLPSIQAPRNARMDLIAVKLPCNKLGKWWRDVARLHLQLTAAKLAASAKGSYDLHILLISDCFPIPNLFPCKELVSRAGMHAVQAQSQYPKRKDSASSYLSSGTAHREAYATILHSAHVYVCGAIAAAQSIRMSGSTRDLVILVDDTISDYHRGGLEAAGWKIHTIQRIRNPKAEPEAYNEWNYSKFQISAIGNNATLFNSGVMSKQKAALEWDRRQAEKANYTDGHWKIKIKDPRLERCFENFCFWESMLWHWGEKNWTDNATTSSSPVSGIKTASLPSL
uniref:Uncharacterized protein n=1 Tax=Chenopodium quinoa TaxID=63459 RepID=A0A803NDN8_CHEQI